jgi:predicted RecB family nuclease
MQRLGDSSWVISASDLATFTSCAWRLARVVDQKLGKGVRVPEVSDPMMDLVARLGLEHESRQLELLKSQMTVHELSYEAADPHDTTAWKQTIAHAHQDTLDALSSGVGALFQATLYEETLPGAPLPIGFQGFADFIVRSGDVWEVWDSKLARRAKDQALIQLAAYADQLVRRGIPLAPSVRIILGDGSHSVHETQKLMPSYLALRLQVMDLIAHRVADPMPLPWSDDTFPPCGSQDCPACAEQRVPMDDLFQIYRITRGQRNAIMTGGLTTLTEFASASLDDVRRTISGIGADTLSGLHLQASLQWETAHHREGKPAWAILSRGILENMPPPSEGDVFFDFEGDPTYQEFSAEGLALGSSTGDGDAVWFGIEYLFGLWGKGLTEGDNEDTFLPLWAETFEQEKAALLGFLELIGERWQAFPDMHVYHYASYERTRLMAMARRHQIDSPVLTALLNDYLVDLLPTVRKGLKVGLPSYGLKALEALYFAPETRTGIAGGGESVVAFAEYSLARARGDQLTADEWKASILHYNRIDCFSTQALRNWLMTDALVT